MLSTRTLDRLASISMFLNSAPGMRGGHPADETLTAGTQLPGLVPALQDGEVRLRVAAAALNRGRELRDRLTQVWALAETDEAAALDAVNALLAEVGPLRLVSTGDAAGFAPAQDPSDAVERLAALAALALAEAAVEGELSRLRVCAGEGCENTLVDASRNRSKRFCDAANCANRTHVRSYRARLAEAADAEPAAAEEAAPVAAAETAEDAETAAALEAELPGGVVVDADAGDSDAAADREDEAAKAKKHKKDKDEKKAKKAKKSEKKGKKRKKES